jgi:hypothetical protein
MSRLWADARRSGTTKIKRKAFEDLGKSGRIFFAHFDEVLGRLTDAEQDALAKAFQYLVTPTGWKVALPAADLAAYAEVDATELAATLERLAQPDARILRTVPLPNRADDAYEIFHDVLADAIIEWRSLREQRQLKASYAVRYGATFSDVVHAHRVWQAATRALEPATELEAAYRATLAGFEEREGAIASAFWATNLDAAVALTTSVVRGRFRNRASFRLQRETDWATRDQPRAGELLHRCDVLGIRADAILDGTRAAIAFNWLHSIQAHVLAALDNLAAPAASLEGAELDTVIDDSERELARVDSYVGRAAEATARRLYSSAAAVGLLAVFWLAVIGWAIARSEGVGRTTTQNIAVAAVAGALGAVVSVLIQAAQKTLQIDYEVGRQAVWSLGRIRPFVGAIFGVAVYLLLARAGGWVRNVYTLSTLGFVAGFAERWVVTRVVGAGLALEKADAAQADPGPPH